MVRARLSRRWPVLALLLALAPAPSAARQVGEPAEELFPPRPRLIQLKVDGLSPLLLDALIDPTPENLERLPDPEGFRRAITLFRQQTGREQLLPNFERYFYEQGVRADKMVSATITLSAVAWGVIDTGQPSVVKRHMDFSRQTGYLRSHLDGFRDTLEITTRRGRKTNALWQLDQAGVSLFADAFHPLRRYEIPQIYYRLTPRDYLVGLAKQYLFAGHSLSEPMKIFRSHASRLVEGMDYPDFNEEYVADHVAEKILEPDFVEGERYDYFTALFTIDHQHHVDPNPENLVHRMIRLDGRLGRIMAAVERSRRRPYTLVTVVSDHGSEYDPGTVNVNWPVTRFFRQELFGGHTVATVMAEDAGRKITSLPGITFPRVYESPYSPYGKAAERKGHKDYVTAFIDNFGNARAEVHLRNNDLNRLHLLLQARHRELDEDGRARLRALFRRVLADVEAWLEPEVEAYRDYFLGVRAWVPQLKERRDPYWRDAAARLEGENERDAAQLRALGRLLELCRTDHPLRWLEEKGYEIPQLIPKKYLGPHNSVYQLTHYTVGLDENLEWVESTVDRRGRRIPLDYISVLSNYRAPNPPRGQEANPTDLIVVPLGVEPLRGTLVERGWLEPAVELQRILWVVSTAQHNTRRGDQALVLEATDGRVRYLPLRHLRQDADGCFTFQRPNQLDPLGLLYDPAFDAATGEPAFHWLQRFHTPREWVAATYGTAYTIAPLVFLDIAGVHTDRFIANPEFARALPAFPSREAKERYLRGLRWKYRAQQPDMLLWSNYLWNYSSKSQTAGGSHGGLAPHVARTTFLLWGGRAFDLPAGEAIEQPATTLDIVPTLANLLGMLDGEGETIRQAGAVREHPLAPMPGEPLLATDPHFLAQPVRQFWPPGSAEGSRPAGPE